MKTSVLARRYAEAFFKVILKDSASAGAAIGKPAGQPSGAAACEQAYDDFMVFVDTVGKNAQLAGVFKHPLISKEKKIAFAQKVLAGASDRVVPDFISLLIKRFRFDLLDEIGRELTVLFRKWKNIVLVQVQTAVPLNAQERSSLIGKLSKRLSGTIEMDEHVNPSLRGGLQLCYEGKVFDATVETRLKLLKERMSNLTSEMLAAAADESSLIAGYPQSPDSPVAESKEPAPGKRL
ncbi:MAG: ATP synthase F1 subunit delta [Candidatus Riflebacteria bacterium]|nr:ATP synthase F1 subunit delta [Candidatus Riflebacteria bacterium]